MLVESKFVFLISLLTVAVHALGIIYAAHAVMNVRSSRGAIAWSISLITFPWLALPLYWVLGRNKFHGYAELLRTAYIDHHGQVNQAYQELLEVQATLPPDLSALQKLAERFVPIPFTTGNAVDLLVDGEQTFPAMLAAIATAQHYILFQFYIINDDELGHQFQQALIQKAAQGVRVYVLYDEIGSNKISRRYVQALQRNGAQVSAFHTTRGRGNRFQLNFRNHRKILVIDGTIGFTGGLNIGDEYLGKKPPLSPWRDTHLRLQGAAVKALQSTFLGDWYWATRELPEVSWVVQPNKRNETALIFATGPADRMPTCPLFLTHLISQSRTRLWVASPYFVPDESVLATLRLAALRGVDVRIILPNRPDHLMVYLCSFSYYTELQAVGIKLYRYKQGFTHQKVILVDDQIAGVGSVNLDNRSFFLNFEVMAYVTHPRFIASVEQMLQQDFDRSLLIDLSSYRQKPFWFRLVVQITRLFAPVL